MSFVFLQQSTGRDPFYWFPEQRLHILLADPEIRHEIEKCAQLRACLTVVVPIFI